MGLERGGFRAFGCIATDKVEHLAYRPHSLVPRVLVLVRDEFVRRLDPAPSEGRERAVFVGREDGVEYVQNGMVRAVDVDGVNVVPVEGKVDAGVGRGVDFLADLFDEWGEGPLEFGAVEVSEGDVWWSGVRSTALGVVKEQDTYRRSACGSTMM